MKFYYYVDKEGVRQGPLPLEDLTPNDISPNTLVFCKGMENWQKAKDVADFDGITHLQETREQGPVLPTIKTEEIDNNDTKFSSVAEYCGISIDSDTLTYIANNYGHKIANIKYIKDKYNIGLKVAKEIIDEIYSSNDMISLGTGSTIETTSADEEEEETSSNRKYWIIGAIIALIAIIGMMFNGNKTETSTAIDSTYVDTIATIDSEEEERIIKEFITNMYNNHLYDEYKFLEKHCSRHLLEKLQEDYEYDHDGVAYAVWDFRTSAQDGKSDGNDKTQIISVTSSGDGWYTYEFYDGGWRGKTRLKCYIQDGEVIMDVLEKIYDECFENYSNKTEKDWTLSGYILSDDTRYPILITFHQSGDELYNCVYKNVTYGGKIHMTGSITEDGFTFEGKDGSKDFVINVSTDYNGGWSGHAIDGDETLEAHLEEN